MPLTDSTTSSDFSFFGLKCSCRVSAQPVGPIARLQFRVEAVGRAEKGDAQGLAEAFEAMAQGGQHTVGVQPFA